MNNKYTCLLVLVLLISSTSCNQNSKTGQNSQEKTNLSESGKAIQQKDITANFTEGEIDVKITTPGSKFGELMQKVDPRKGDIKAQMKTLASQLSAKEKAEIQTQMKKNGMLNLAVMMIPIRTQLYVKGDEATAKFDALTFHGETYVNFAQKGGLVYMKSQNSSNDISVSYTGSSFKKMATNEIDLTNYNIEKTNEIQKVAGYACKKNIYTRKNAPASQPSVIGMPTGNAFYKLEVWTSKQVPKSVNFLHPLYVEEEAGIMKILVQYEQSSDFKLLYEFNNLERRLVAKAEMEIRKTTPVYDYGKDEMAVGMKLMGIIFGR